VKAGQIYFTHFDRRFLALPLATRRRIEAAIDAMGLNYEGSLTIS
jgi:hypothetical protein